MVLSDASAIGLIEDVQFLTGTPDDFSSALIKRFINEGYRFAQMLVFAAMDQWDFQGETATASLVANQREYIFPTDLLKINRVEAQLDGTNWIKLKKFDPRQFKSLPLSSETDITNAFSNGFGSASYELFDSSMYLYTGTISSVTNGLKIWYENGVTALSSNSDEPVLAPAFHRVLSLYAAKTWAAKHEDSRLYSSLVRELGEDMGNGKYSGLLGSMQTYYANREVEEAPKIKAKRERFE